MQRLGNLKIRKTAAGIIVVMMLFAVLFSTFFIALEADHDCCGDGCPICAFIAVCENILLGMSRMLSVSEAGFAILLVIFSLFIFYRAIVFGTPVSRKVRIND